MNDEALNPEIEDALDIVSMVSSSISLTAVILLALIYLKSPRSNENVFFQMVLAMLFPNIIFSICGFTYRLEDSSDVCCYIIAFLRQYAFFATTHWAMLISWHIKSSISEHHIKSFSRYYYLIGYVGPLIFAGLPLINSTYGKTITRCSITTISMNIIAHYFPLLCLVSFTFYCYYSIIRELKQQVSEEAAKEFYALLIYPLFSFLYNIGSFIHMLLWVTYKSKSEAMEIVTVIYIAIIQSQGCCDAIIYSLNYAIRKDIREKFLGHGSQRSNTVVDETTGSEEPDSEWNRTFAPNRNRTTVELRKQISSKVSMDALTI